MTYVEHPHETARLNALADELTLGTAAWKRNCAAGFSPFAWTDPRHEATRVRIEQIESVRKARAEKKERANG
jgi:hypothetical protein